MTSATGLGMVDIAILEACERSGAVCDAAHLNTQRVLEMLHEQTGFGPRVAYEPLLDLARPYSVHLPLIDFHGNYGSPDFGPAAPRYTECRLTPLGQAALSAERGEIGPVPILLINGDTHVGGRRPPLDPRRVVEAIRNCSSLDDAGIAATVGLPMFPTGCIVDGNRDAFTAGLEVGLVLTARISEGHDGRSPRNHVQLVISDLPPDASASAIAETIVSRIDRARRSTGPPGRTPTPEYREEPPPISDINDASAGGITELVVTVTQGADAVAARRFLDTIWGVRRTMTVCLGRPVATLVREFIERSPGDLEHRLTLIEAAIRR